MTRKKLLRHRRERQNRRNEDCLSVLPPYLVRTLSVQKRRGETPASVHPSKLRTFTALQSKLGGTK